MGFRRHVAIVVTCFDFQRTETARDKARLLELRPTNVVVGAEGGYCSFLIPPNGGSEESEMQVLGDERRGEFKEWMLRSELGRGYLEWVEVSFGGDGGSAEVVACSDDC